MKIEWSETQWNPIVGCSPVSEGCRYCYAKEFHERMMSNDHPKYREPFSVVRCFPELLDLPKKWRQPRSRIFVNSMSDLFHPEVPEDFIIQVFQTIKGTSKHTYQVLTKRSKRVAEFSEKHGWAENAWAGVSVESKAYLHRLDDLRRVRSRKFLSAEPLLESLGKVNLDGIDWIICGGESGKQARPWSDDWARELRDLCVEAGIPFFFKQRRRPDRRIKERQFWMVKCGIKSRNSEEGCSTK